MKIQIKIKKPGNREEEARVAVAKSSEGLYGKKLRARTKNKNLKAPKKKSFFLPYKKKYLENEKNKAGH